ncbi:hypothetical protein VNO78_32752 [Psophocarpus tetragonolobus]|uniref:Uncharacterized protein n=1 Tax=Psophocarpus tetragonolobus TaxID=3891 RepID=A0AAN9NWQ0_PSOTE
MFPLNEAIGMQCHQKRNFTRIERDQSAWPPFLNSSLRSKISETCSNRLLVNWVTVVSVMGSRESESSEI